MALPANIPDFTSYQPGLGAPAEIQFKIDGEGMPLVFSENQIPRGILCGTAGGLNGKDAKGNVIANLPLQAGYNPIRVSEITDLLGGAADIWVLY